MTHYRAPVDEIAFLLEDVLESEARGKLPAFEEVSPDVLRTVMSEGARFTEQVLHPINMSGDREGCRRSEDGGVVTPAGFKEAYRRYRTGGWTALASDPAHGGQGLPFAVGTVLNEFCASANLAFSMVSGLSQSAVSALLAHGSEVLKARYAPKLVSGEWSGTMNLTEPQCGTDLGLIRSRAVPGGDGEYAIFGQKIYISAGEHDLTDNIIHLVLARTEGAPAGTRGLSLFLVPKILPDASGALGARNGVSCGGIERKMGLHASATCVMNYDGATGWLVGEESRGLQAMFVMMNEARIGVATQALALSEIAYQNAAAYAKQRLQGRSLSRTADPSRPSEPIIVHPDVRRTLLSIRSFNEGARALLLWTAIRADIARHAPDQAVREAAQDHLDLLTPVLKGVLTDVGFRNCVEAQQVFGGAGYIVDTGVEQFVRDARVTMIYEGANGIQALDLVARKLPRNGGRAYLAFMAEVGAFVSEHELDGSLAPVVGRLKAALEHLGSATTWFLARASNNPDHAAAGSTDYMHMFGLVAIGYMWGRIAKAALAGLGKADAGEREAMEARMLRARFFMERTMPETGAHLARIRAGADTMMAMPVNSF